MESKTDSTRPILDSGDIERSADDARAFAQRLVAERVADGEQRMAAYYAVGRLASHCESWVRRLIRGDVKKVDARAYLGLRAADEDREARQLARAAALLQSGAKRRERANAWLAGTVSGDACLDRGQAERDHGDDRTIGRSLSSPGVRS